MAIQVSRADRASVAEKEAVARRLVGHWPRATLERVVRGFHTPSMRSLHLEHASVLERAALICLDVIDDKRPDDPSAWSKQKLLARIAILKAGKPDPAKIQPATNQPRTPYRVEQSPQVRQKPKVDPSEARRNEIARQKRVRQLRETELAEERKRLELVQAAIRAEQALPPEIRALRKRITELSGIIATKENTLFNDTLNERAHDRIYESLQRDRENLAALQKALSEQGS